MAKVRTFCRICEAHCGLVVDVEDEKVRKVAPDRDHPVSQGYVCVKGLALDALHEDPDRLNYPMKRVGDRFERITWAQALREIGTKVKALRAAHGDRSIAHYAGNPTYFSFQNVLFSAAFLEALGSPNHFASHSIDANPKFDVSTQIYGLSIVQPVPDLDHTELFVCLGSNPVVSQMSIVQLPNSLARLRAIEARGGRVVIVDPRRTETAAKVGEHLAIVPGTDVYLLLAMLHVIAHEEDRIDRARLRSVARGVDAFCEAALPWTPERAAAITGIDAATIRELSLAFVNAKGACLYMSTGVNMGPFGSLAYWLLQGLHLVAGQLDRRGGLLVPEGAFDAFRLAKVLGLGAADPHRTLVSDWHRVAGAFPTAALAEEIETDHPERIRALFVSCGNPVHSAPGRDLERALGRLELVVSIDLYRNETAKYADYLLPATDMLERSDFPVSWTMLQIDPHAQYTPAVVSPKFERREEWRIFSDLAVACGARALGPSLCQIVPRVNALLRPLGREMTPDHLLALLLRWGGQTTLKTLRKIPEGVALRPNQPGSFLGKRVFTRDRRVHLDAPRLLADLPRLETYARSVVERDDRLFLIGRRQRKSHNSWMHNLPRIRPEPAPHALLHPDDAAAREVEDGTLIIVEGPEGSVSLPARITSDVARGVIAIPHGWGHAGAGLSFASTLGGGNINKVIPGGEMEISGQAIMLAHRVRVRADESGTLPAEG
ncbi:MAG: molybdopterin-dependent oxidoreductase [Myxococcota bacterium]